MAFTRIPLKANGRNMTAFKHDQQNLADMLKLYLSGEPVYIELSAEPMRVGAIARLKLEDDVIQDLLHGEVDRHRWYGSRTAVRQRIEPKPENVVVENMGKININGSAVWDGRKNRVNYLSGWNMNWLKGHEGGTVWVYQKVQVPKVVAKDKLDREIKVNDFISYILYQFDGEGAAGIYYGKVTKVDDDGSVWAKNIKLKSDDKQAEKRIHHNGLIVIMTKDLMDQLMLAKLSSL